MNENPHTVHHKFVIGHSAFRRDASSESADETSLLYPENAFLWYLTEWVVMKIVRVELNVFYSIEIVRCRLLEKQIGNGFGIQVLRMSDWEIQTHAGNRYKQIVSSQ